MGKDDFLFVKYDLRAVLEAHERKMLDAIDAIDQKELLGLSNPRLQQDEGLLVGAERDPRRRPSALELQARTPPRRGEQVPFCAAPPRRSRPRVSTHDPGV